MGMGFDKIERYTEIAKIVNSLRGSSHPKILDVGGFPCDLLQFLPYEDITIVDQPECSNERYIQASGTELPFADNSFSIVVTSDTLEHIQKNQRDRFLSELFRVAENYIVISAPFHSQPVLFAENSLDELYRAIRQSEHPWLSEHLRNKLPDLDSVIYYFSSKGCTVKTLGSGNLYTWMLMMGVSMLSEFDSELSALYEQFQDIFVKISKTDMAAQVTYRKILIIPKSDQPEPHFKKYENFKETINEDVIKILEDIKKFLFNLAGWLTQKKPQENAEVKAEYAEVLEKILLKQRKNIDEDA